MMEDKERDAYLLEILDRLARLETKFDSQVDSMRIANEADDRSQSNARAIDELTRRVDGHDAKWETDRAEKRTMWITLIGGCFALVAAIAGALITILFS